ncbi:MAG: hypothetical protein OEQ74_02750, partial [Gammaproteobacteria bacterium]|nr:hypothetical protein [Gammaproteobacteria bacterium]
SHLLAQLPCDRVAFSEHFDDRLEMAVFDNLGADAVLVAPAPIPQGAQYTHLAAFCRTAPLDLSVQFWQCLGETCLEKTGDKPIWISTAGTGIGWLHARLDTYPKYYSHDPYRCRP